MIPRDINVVGPKESGGTYARDERRKAIVARIMIIATIATIAIVALITIITVIAFIAIIAQFKRAIPPIRN